MELICTNFLFFFPFYFHPFFFSSFHNLVVYFMLFESKLVLHKCWLVVFVSIISVDRIWIFLFADTWLQNMCDSRLLIGVHFVTELSAPTVGPRRENMVLVLSLAWHVKHPSGTLYSGESECVPGDQRQWLRFFVVFVGPSSPRSVNPKLVCDHILSNSPFTVEKVMKWLQSHSVYYSI